MYSQFRSTNGPRRIGEKAPSVEHISFHLNGQEHIVPNDVDPSTSLVDYIRGSAKLTGTKVSCREGGCGACVVTAQYIDPVTGTEKTRAVNSCLCPLSIVRGWKVTTTEGIGEKQTGFHPIQQRMTDHCATQCGFCTPGFVMSIYGLLKENPTPTSEEALGAIDGNLCRCTGYRSIVDAVQSFCPDVQEAKPIDIEDLQKLHCVQKQACPGQNVARRSPAVHGHWKRPSTLGKLYTLLEESNGKSVRLVFGNTSTGVYKNDKFDINVDIREVGDLYKVNATDTGIEVGASVTLTQLQELCIKYQDKPGFGYLTNLKAHIDVVGTKPIRNSGSWAGNLMMQHRHNDFPSDLLPVLETIGADIVIGSLKGERRVKAQNLLDEDMKKSVILAMRLPALNDKTVFSAYKVMPRRQGAHSYTTGAFCVEFSDNAKRVVKKASVVFGGINDAKEHHASTVESFMAGKDLSDKEVKQGCLEAIAKDPLIPTDNGSNDKYRSELARNLVFKFLEQFCSDGLQIGPTRLTRPSPSGTQDFETIPDKYPLTESVPKLAATIQTSGETVYVDDMPRLANELAAAIVLSTIAKGEIENIDTSAALAVPGIVDVLTANMLPGKNFCDPIKMFADEAVEYNGQPVAMVLADTLELAKLGVSLVKVTYKNVQTPVLDLDEAFEKGQIITSIDPLCIGDVDEGMKKCKQVIEGRFHHGAQYHFYLETQGCLVVPREGNYDVWSSTQGTDDIQAGVASVLDIKASRVLVTAPRVGGGFGGKSNNAQYVAAMTALAAAKTNRPVRFITPLDTCMKYTSHRPPVTATYKAGVDENGKIHALEMNVLWDSGHVLQAHHPFIMIFLIHHADALYHFPNMKGGGSLVKTDTQTSYSMRSPSQLVGHLIIDHIMEHVAQVLAVDPIIFKEKHLCDKDQMMICGSPMPDDHARKLWAETLEMSELVARQKAIEQFNKENRWVKRGLAIAPAKFLVNYYPFFSYTAYMAVYHHDGSVVISHGGVEFGQGLHTKVTQVAMRELGLPKEMITCASTNTVTAPNTSNTGGSMPSEYLCRTVQVCCQVLLKKLEPFKEKSPDADWFTLVQQAYMAGVHLAVTDRYISPTFKPLDYVVLGVCVAEAEVDILTGENQILRTDMRMDIGESVNPAIDVGQVEGALVMGLGQMLTERETRHPETGELLTASTWDYYPPTAHDIPADMRISFSKGKPNTAGVYTSKALGEPPICSSSVFLSAVKTAVGASRKERGKSDSFDLYAPATRDTILAACDISSDELK